MFAEDVHLTLAWTAAVAMTVVALEACVRMVRGRRPGRFAQVGLGLALVLIGMSVAAGLAMLVQQGLAEDPFNGAVYGFRGRRAGLIKLLWYAGVGLCLLAKKLEHGQFVWPTTTTTGCIGLSTPQLAVLLDGCEWRAPVRRPSSLSDSQATADVAHCLHGDLRSL